MVTELKTQAELEALISDPVKFHDYQQGIFRDLLGDEFKTIAKDTISKALKENGLKRPPMIDPKQGASHNPDAVGAGGDGKFRRFGEFLRLMHPKTIMMDGMDSRLADLDVAKALGESSGDAGGFLVPEEFRAELLALALEQTIVRQRARVIPMTSESVRFPVIKDTTHATNVFGGVQAFWNPEASDISADSSQPAFGQRRWTAHKLTGYTIAGNELLADSAVALEALLMMLFSGALAYFEDLAFFDGTGSGQPEGILNASALVTVAKEGGQPANTIVAENLDKMYARMLPSSQGNTIWVANQDIFPQLAALSRSVGTGGSPIWMANAVGGPPSSIYGRPLILTEKAQTLGTKGDLFYLDLNYYLIGDRQALTMSASEHVRFTTDEMVWKFVQRLDAKPWITSALTPRNGTKTVSPFVTLATRA